MPSGATIARQRIRDLLADEVGTIRKDAPRRVALVYPSPYRAAMHLVVPSNTHFERELEQARKRVRELN